MITAKQSPVLAEWGCVNSNSRFIIYHDHGPVFLATGWVGKCPREVSVPLAPEDEFRIKSSCFCLGKSWVFELIQPFQIALFCFCMLRPTPVYALKESYYLCGWEKQRKRQAESETVVRLQGSYTQLQTYKSITYHEVFFSSDTQFMSDLSHQSCSGIAINLSLWLPSSPDRIFTWQPKIR